MSKRLVIIALLGIILISAAYWYFNRPPEPPPQPLARLRAAKTQPPKPLTPLEPPQRKSKAAEPRRR